MDEQKSLYEADLAQAKHQEDRYDWKHGITGKKALEALANTKDRADLVLQLHLGGKLVQQISWLATDNIGQAVNDAYEKMDNDAKDSLTLEAQLQGASSQLPNARNSQEGVEEDCSTSHLQMVIISCPVFVSWLITAN